MSTIEEAHRGLAAVMDGYRAAVHAKNVDAFVALYDPAVRIFDAWDRWSYDGTDAWRALVAGWFASLGDSRVEVDFDDVQTVAGTDLAVLHAFVRYRNVAVDGTVRHAMWNRLTWTLRPGDAGWTIVHEHTSAPIDHDTMKASLQR